jgi:hypothetical protein
MTTIRFGREEISDHWNGFEGFRKFNGFSGFLFNRFVGYSRFLGFSGFFEVLVSSSGSSIEWHAPCSIAAAPRIQRDERFRDHLDGAVASAPRLFAEGFGRYLPGRFQRVSA